MAIDQFLNYINGFKAEINDLLRRFDLSIAHAANQVFSAVGNAGDSLQSHLGGGAWRQTRDLASAFPNLRFDCSEIIAWAGAAAAPTALELAQLIRDVGADRVMLGTDFPWYDLDTTVEQVNSLPLLADEEKDQILGRNAAGLLILSESPAGDK